MPEHTDPPKRRRIGPSMQQIADYRLLGLDPHDTYYGGAYRALANFANKTTEERGYFIERQSGSARLEAASAGAIGAAPVHMRPGMAMTMGLIKGLMDLVGIGGEEEKVPVGTPAPDAPTIDPTDPSIDPTQLGVNLTGREMRMRSLRRALTSTRLALQSPTGIPTMSGIELGIQNGELQPATTTADHVADNIGLLLAGTGVFAPLGAYGAAARGYQVAAGATEATLAAQAAARTASAAGVVGKVPGATGFAKALAGKFGVPEDKVLQLLGNLGLDIGLGAGWGVAEGLGEEAVTGHDAPTSLYAGLGAIGGTVLGGAIHGYGFIKLKNAQKTVLAAGHTAAMSERLPLVKGDVVDGYTFKGYRRDGRPMWHKDGKFAKGPSPEALEGQGVAMVRDLAERLSAQERAAAEALEVISPETWPKDLVPEAKTIYAQMADYWPHFENWVKMLRRTKGEGAAELILQRQLIDFRQMSLDANLPMSQRVTSASRALAIEKMLGTAALEEERFLVERGAMELAHQGRQRGAAWLDEELARQRSTGNTAMAVRAEELFTQGVPQAEHAAVRARAFEASKRLSRGLGPKSKVVYKGQVVEIIENPNFGVARGRVLGETVDGGPLVAVDLTEATPLPSKGSVAWMGDKLVDVQTVDIERGTFTATDPFDPNAAALEYKLGDIVALDDSPSAKKTTEQVKAAIARELAVPREETSPVTPTEAVTSSGEPVIVTEVGAKTAKVQTRSGKAKQVPKSEVKRGKGTPVAAGVGEREVIPFTAGQLPTRAAERNKLVYVQVPRTLAPAFEEAWKKGTINEFLAANASAADQLGNPIVTSVLPPQAWHDNISLYGLEIASKRVPKRLYTEEANNVLALVGGQGKKVQSYESTINLPAKTIQDGQIYSVPEELYAQAVLDEEALSRMSLAQQRDYLRKLLVLNEDVWTEVAVPAAKARAARAQQVEATSANAGQAAAAAEVEHARQSAQALEAAIGKTSADDAIAQATTERTIAAQSDDVDVRTLFERNGLDPDTVEWYQNEIDQLWPSDPKMIDEEQLVMLHGENPGQRLVVSARRSVDLRPQPGKGRAPALGKYYQVQAIDAEGYELARWQVQTTDEVVRLVGEGGYAPDLLYSTRGRYTHRSNPKLTAEVLPAGRGSKAGEEVLAVVERRAELPEAKREGHLILQGTPDEAAALQPFAKKHFLQLELSENAPGDPIDIRVRPMPETQGGGIPTLSETEAAKAMSLGPEELRARVREQHFSRIREFVQEVRDAGLISGRKAQMVLEEVPRRTNQHMRQAAVDAARAEGAITEAEATQLESRIAKTDIAEEDVPVWAKVNKKLEDLGSGAIVHRTIAKKRFGTWEEAEAWLAEQGFKEADFDRRLLSISSPVDEFNAFPALEKIEGDAEALLEMHPKVEWVLKQFYNEQRYVPDAVKEYAARFGRAYEQQVGVAPFERDMREIIGIRTLDDLTPKMARPGDMADRAINDPFIEEARGGMSASDTDVVNRYLWERMEGQKMQPKETRHVIPRDWVPPEQIPGHYSGLLIRHSPPGSKTLSSSVRLMENQERVTTWTNAALKAESRGDASLNVFSPDNVSYARIKATKVPVRIVDPDVVGRQVMVRDPHGAEFLLPKSDLTLIRPKSSSMEGVQYEIAAAIADGRYGGYNRSHAPLGRGQYEEELGLLGTNSYRAVREMALPDLTQRWEMTMRGNMIRPGLEDDFERLMLDIERTQWLSNQQFVRGKGDKTKWVSIFDEFIKQLPKDQQRDVRYALYQRAKQRFGNSPAGEAIARAYSTKVGRSKSEPYALTKKQAEGLIQWAKDWGYTNPERVPLGFLAEKAMIDSPLHPVVSRVIARMHKDAGFLNLGGLMDKSGIAYNSIDMVWPRGGDINPFTRYFGISHNVADRHPTSRMFLDSIRYAEEQELRRTARAENFLRKMHHEHKYSDGDLKELKQLLGKYTTWEEAAAAGAPEHLAVGFTEWRQEFESWLEDLVRYYLRRNIQPLEFNPDNAAMADWVTRELGLDAAKIKKGALFFAPNPETGKKLGATTASKVKRWTTDEIEEFLHLRRSYASAAELPEGTPQDYIKIFDFWKGWRVDNYWPTIHEGNMGIFRVGEDGTEELIGWVRSLPEAMEALDGLHQRGMVNVLQDKVRLRQTREHVDDIMIRRTPNSELPRTIQQLAEEASLEPDEVRALFVRAEGVPKDVVRSPLIYNAMQRKINLPSVLDDPAREFQIYAARVARGHYRLDVIDAWNMAQNARLDRALSDAMGTAPLHSKDMNNLRAYLSEELMPVALGERGKAERSADWFVGHMLGFRHAPEWAIGQITGKTKGIPWSAWQQVWKAPYRARKMAGDMIGFQSSFRLFGSLSSAMANASQHYINTAPLLMGEGVTAKDAIGMAVKANVDGIRLWKWNTQNEARAMRGLAPKPLPEKLARLQQLIDESNVLLMPGKHLAGAGGTSWGQLAGTRLPVPYGQTKLARTWDVANYAGMLMFNGAEQVNRMGALIAGYQKAVTRLGMDHKAAIQYAKRLVRDTQFLYDELAMPALFHNLGPAGRLLFQFKGYIWNQVSLEAKLARKALTGDPTAMKQLTGHLGAYFVLGGARGLAAHPVVSSVAAVGLGAAGLFGFPKIGPLDEWLMYKNRELRLQRTAPEDVMENKLAYHYSDLLAHGVPALLGMTLGQRIGVSGQEIANLLEFNPNTLGPHLSTHVDFLKMLWNYAGTAKSESGLRGAAIGGLAATVLPRAVTTPVLTGAGLALQAAEARSAVRPGDVGTFMLTGQRGYHGMAGAILGGWLASKGNELDLATFIASSEYGKAWRNRALPTMARAWNNAVDLYTDQSIYDIDGKPMHLPPGRSTWEEVVTAFANLPTMRREEYRATIGYLVGQNDKINRERRGYVEAIGYAARQGDMEKVYDLILEAQESGITLDETSIQRELDARTQEALQTVRDRLTVEARYPD